MSHSKSLRIIGQTLEIAGLRTFKLEKHTDAYRLWVGKELFRFGRADISRLDALAQKKRRYFPATATRPPSSLCQQLRALGGYLDRIEVNAFRLVWTDGSAILDYERVNGERNNRVFTAEELRQVGLHRSLLRSAPQIFPRLTELTPGTAKSRKSLV